MANSNNGRPVDLAPRSHDMRTTVLVLGASGMLGSMLFRVLSESTSLRVFGTIRNPDARGRFAPSLRDSIFSEVNVESESSILKVLASVRPAVVINCVGIVKQLPNSKDHLESLIINSLLPHRLARYCTATSARLIHFSTDCVFSGKSGSYKEDDFPDADDLYGRSKFLGEVTGSGVVTLRTSIIGHELAGSRSLIDWFLAQEGMVRGYKNAIFSGLPTVHIARITRDFIIPNSRLSGLYHLSAEPISKFELLRLVASRYRPRAQVTEDGSLVVDRSLDSTRFRTAAGFSPLSWPELIQEMAETRSLGLAQVETERS